MIILRYLTREILLTTAAIAFCLFLLFFGNRFTQYLDQAASGELAAGAILTIVSYRIPDIMVLILPFAYFLGVLVAYGRLYSDNEMVVLSSGGVSQARLLSNTLLSAVIMATIVGGLTLVVAPYTLNKVEEIKVEQQNRSFFELLHPGRFEQVNEEEALTYHFERFSSEGNVIEKVFVADVTLDRNDVEVPLLITAQTAREVDPSNAGNRYLALTEGHQYVGNPGALEYQVSHFGSSGRLIETNDEEDVNRKYWQRLSTMALWQQSGPKSQAELQWRLSMPILVIVLGIIAVPLSYTNPRRGRYAKIFPAFIPTIFYLGLLVVMKGKVNNGEVSTKIGLWWVHGLFLSIAILLLWWNNGRPLGKWKKIQSLRSRSNDIPTMEAP